MRVVDISTALQHDLNDAQEAIMRRIPQDTAAGPELGAIVLETEQKQQGFQQAGPGSFVDNQLWVNSTGFSGLILFCRNRIVTYIYDLR